MPEWEESRSTKTVERNACGQWDVMDDFGIMVTSKASVFGVRCQEDEDSDHCTIAILK